MLLLLAVSSAAAFWASFPATENDEAYLQGLIGRKEKGEILASGEEKDFCELMALLRDSVSVECVSVLDGINWHRPPKSPEELGENWEEVTDEKQKEAGNHRKFRHKKHNKITVIFDEAVEGEPGFKGIDHWHRENPNRTHKKENFYLDKNGAPVTKGSRESHIHN